MGSWKIGGRVGADAAGNSQFADTVSDSAYKII
jgi:hypothetical protein